MILSFLKKYAGWLIFLVLLVILLTLLLVILTSTPQEGGFIYQIN